MSHVQYMPGGWAVGGGGYVVLDPCRAEGVVGGVCCTISIPQLCHCKKISSQPIRRQFLSPTERSMLLSQKIPGC